MAARHDRERFIPFRKADIVEMCIDDSGLADDEKADFREFCQILEKSKGDVREKLKYALKGSGNSTFGLGIIQRHIREPLNPACRGVARQSEDGNPEP